MASTSHETATPESVPPKNKEVPLPTPPLPEKATHEKAAEEDLSPQTLAEMQAGRESLANFEKQAKAEQEAGAAVVKRQEAQDKKNSKE